MNDKATMRPSDEAEADQLRLGKAQGDAYARACAAMKKETGKLAETTAGDYVIACTAEDAEGLWRPADGRLEWHEPDGENAHVEVAVRDKADGRFVPGLSVTVTIRDQQGREIGTHEQPFLWHPWLYHYGRNWTLPGDGSYTVRVRIAPPAYPRHDLKNGNRYAQPVEVEFGDLRITTGQKHST